MNIGFIGLGNMGAGMAGCLLKAGFPLIVYDLLPEAAKPLLNGGATWAKTLREIAAACDLAVCCDLRIASDTARLSMHPVRVGTAYQFEVTQRFINVVGSAFTRELFFTASPVSAKRALEMGLVNHLFPAKDLLNATETIARNIADLPPLAVKGTKEIITKLLRFQQTLTEKQQAELRAISAVARQSEDVREAVRALFEGRKPMYTGK